MNIEIILLQQSIRKKYRFGSINERSKQGQVLQ